MTTYVVIGVIVLFVGGAVLKLVKDKKRGAKCPGCPYCDICNAKQCSEHFNNN